MRGTCAPIGVAQVWHPVRGAVPRARGAAAGNADAAAANATGQGGDSVATVPPPGGGARSEADHGASVGVRGGDDKLKRHRKHGVGGGHGAEPAAGDVDTAEPKSSKQGTIADAEGTADNTGGSRVDGGGSGSSSGGGDGQERSGGQGRKRSSNGMRPSQQ